MRPGRAGAPRPTPTPDPRPVRLAFAARFSAYQGQMKTSDSLLLVGALVVGLLLALVDISSGWDDTGVSAAAVFVAAAVFGATRPSRAWLWALAVGLWIPVLGIVVRGNLGALIALVPALLGALAGAAARRLFAGTDGAA
jgi:hypothetical protein